MFQERYNYLRFTKRVGVSTFGFDRYINQSFYVSREWKRIRDQVIIRDSACDLGIPGHEILDKIIIHHMNPITMQDFEDSSEYLTNLNYLICCSHNTHNAIHFGNEKNLMSDLKERRKGDTTPWIVS